MRIDLHKTSDATARYRLHVRINYQPIGAKAIGRARPEPSPSVEALLALVAETSGFTIDALLQRVKRRGEAEARHMTVLLARAAGHTYPRIGRAMARDHTTAVHSYHRALALYDYDARFRETLALVIAAARAAGVDVDRFAFERPVLAAVEGGAA
jgi:hypothetical protein